MRLADVQALAETYLEHYNLPDWKFAFNNRVSSSGLCNYRRKTIYISKKLALINPESLVENTIRHEIAHALVGPFHGHDEVWYQKALEIGCDGKVCNEYAVQPESRYFLNCNHCGYKYKYNRKPKPTLLRACGKCCRKHNNGKYSEQFALKLEKNPAFTS